MNVVAYDPFVTQEQCDVKMVSLEELMERSDFVSIHSRMTKETYHMVNADMLAKMKPTAYLINTARSGLVDEDALFECLKERKIAGAALDVFDLEPPGATYKMIPLDNVTVTPHLAGGTRDAFSYSPVLLLKELQKLWIDKKSTHFLLNGKECADHPWLQELTR